MSILYEGEWRTLNLALANVTSEKTAGSFLPGDNLEIPSGSLSLNNVTVAEYFNGINFTFEAIVGTYFIPGDGLIHYLFDNQGTGASEDRVRCFIDAAGLLTFVVHDTDSTQHLVSHDVTDWKINEEHYVVCTLDFNANTIVLFVDGTSEDSTPDNALSADSVAAIEANTHIGSDTNGANYLNGKIKYRFWDRTLSATEVTAAWDSGDLVEFSIISPDVIAMDNFTQSGTGINAHHSGKLVSNIVAGGTEATLTTADGAEVFGDGEAVIVQGGTGFAKYGFADGAGSGNTLLVDNGAGGAVTDIEKVGVHADLNGTSECFFRTDADFPESGITGATDLTIQLWLNADSFPAEQVLVNKYYTTGNKRMYRFHLRNNQLAFNNSSDGENYHIGYTSLCNLVINKWYHVAAVYDASAGTVDFYLNGYFIEQETGYYTTIADKDPDFFVGSIRQASGFFGGGLFNVALFDDKRTAAEILASATDPIEDLSGAGNIIGQWYFNDAAGVTQIDNNEGTAGGDLDLIGGVTTNFGTHTREQIAFVTKNHLITEENCGIGGVGSIDSTWTVTKDTTVKFMDSRSLKGVCAAGDDGDEFTLASPQLVNGQSYWQTIRVWVPTIHDDTTLHLDVDGAATPITSREVGKSLSDDGHFARSFNLDETYSLNGGNILNVGVNDFSISMWVTKLSADYAYCIKKGDPGLGYGVAIEGGELYGFLLDAGGRQILSKRGSGLDDGNWHFIAITFDRDGVAIPYIDGVAYPTTDISGTAGSLTAVNNLYLGHDPIFWDGSIADAKIWTNGIWSPAEILDLKNNPFDLSVVAGKLTDAWFCDDNAANTVVVSQAGGTDLVASANTEDFAEEHWKRYDICWQADQQAIEVNLSVTGAGAGANALEVNVDAGQLRVNKITNGGFE